MKIKIGDKAPDFILFNSLKEKVALSDYRDQKLLILFFPAAFSGVCTDELCSVRNGLSEYTNLNAKVIGISCDSPFALAKFAELNKYEFTLLSDYNKVICAAYGCQYDDFVLGMKGNAKRSAFIVNGKGEIRYAEISEKATDLPNFEKIKEVLSNM